MPSWKTQAPIIHRTVTKSADLRRKANDATPYVFKDEWRERRKRRPHQQTTRNDERQD